MSTLPPSQRANVLRAYRELLSLARRLPAAQRDAALAEARAGVRANAAEVNPLAASEQLKRLWGRVGVLRMVRCVMERGRAPRRELRRRFHESCAVARRALTRLRRRRCPACLAIARAAAAPS